MKAGGDCGTLQKTVIKRPWFRRGRPGSLADPVTDVVCVRAQIEMVGPKTAGIVAAVKDVQLTFQLSCWSANERRSRRRMPDPRRLAPLTALRPGR